MPACLLRRNPAPIRAAHAFILLATAPLLAAFLLFAAPAAPAAEPAPDPSAQDTVRIQRSGGWEWTSHRYASHSALETTEDGAALAFSFTGTGLILCLDALTPPNNYGPPELGRLEISVDGAPPAVVRPRSEDREVVIARTLAPREHTVRLVHRRDAAGAGCRIRGFRTLPAGSGELAIVVSGERSGALIDVRAILTRGGRIVRDPLVRNWLTGQCRLAGLAPGDDYTLELRAAGWKPWRQENIIITAGRETVLPAAYLERGWDASNDSFKFPAPGRPVVRRAGESFRTRFEAYRDNIRGARLIRRHGPAVISRPGHFVEDKGAAYYYHREGEIVIPPDTPAGLYDLEIQLGGPKGERSVISPRSVNVVTEFPRDPVFVTFGHLDTWGQEQAEYLARIVEVANLIAPDMVLDSNDANPAYVAGALLGLDMPFVVNFGNHRGPEPGPWFGEPIGLVDFGPDLCVLNFGRAWDTSRAEAEELLAARATVACKVINAFEPNAPIVSFLDRHRIALIHEAHGPGAKVEKLGATPTVRVGKVNSESFRVVRFQGARPVAFTYRGHATAPIPFPRGAPPPIRVVHSAANDGTHADLSATCTNDLDEAFPQARLVFVLPHGNYRVTGGRVESAIASDDQRFTVLTVRCDFPAKAETTVRVRPAARGP